MRRILVTGAGGQLGHALREWAYGRAAEEKGAGGEVEWLFTDVNPATAAAVFPGRPAAGAQVAAGGGFLLAELDITDRGAVEDFFERERPAIVVNCAAFTDVDRAETEREAALRVNRDAPRFLAEASAARGAALVHISTDFVFKGDAESPYTEEDGPAPLNFYGESKLAGERELLLSGVRGAVVRTSWLYSPWGRNFVKSIINAAAKNAELRVVADQRGCPTSAASLAAAIMTMVAADDAPPSSAARAFSGPAALFHFCDAGVVSRADFAAEIIRQAGLDCRVVPVPSDDYPSAAQRPGYSALDTSKITREYGIVPRPWAGTLSECIKELLNGR